MVHIFMNELLWEPSGDEFKSTLDGKPDPLSISR